jgi:transcriptional antiterminator RfaH
MPILPLEPFVYPNHLFEQSGCPDQENGRWWVLHTRPRAEKALARRLLGRDVRFFLPQYCKQWRNKGRSSSVHHPLFPGYLFLHGDDQDRLYALQTNLVAQVLHVEDQAELHSDLTRVHHLMVTDACLTPEEQLEPGVLVHIIHGPLAGLQGKVVARHNKMRFVVEVRFLQQGVSLDVEGWMLERLSGPAPVTARV